MCWKCLVGLVLQFTYSEIRNLRPAALRLYELQSPVLSPVQVAHQSISAPLVSRDLPAVSSRIKMNKPPTELDYAD